MINQKYLQECFFYNQETGEFFWKERPLKHFKNISAMKTFNTKQAGKIAGHKMPTGYLALSFKKKTAYLHRLAWIYVNGEIPEPLVIDHMNGVRDDDRI